MSYSCSICTSPLSKDPVEPNSKKLNIAPISCTPCGHMFHHYCIHRWLSGEKEYSRFCPSCRKATSKASIRGLFPTISEDDVDEQNNKDSCPDAKTTSARSWYFNPFSNRARAQRPVEATVPPINYRRLDRLIAVSNLQPQGSDSTSPDSSPNPSPPKE